MTRTIGQIAIDGFGKKYNTHVTVKDYNIDNSYIVILISFQTTYFINYDFVKTHKHSK